MQQSSGFDGAYKRPRNAIECDNSFRDRTKRNHQAFQRILRLYIDSKFYSPPMRSSLTMLDPTQINPHWNPDTACIVCDVERCVERALDDDPALLDQFWKLFVMPEFHVEPVTLSKEETKVHGQIVQRVGREFIKRGLFPLYRYFNATPRKEWQAFFGSNQ